jgi:hypothetical protein
MNMPDFLQKERTLYLLQPEDIKTIAELVAKTILEGQAKPPLSPVSGKPITQDEATKFLGKSRQTLTAWRKKGIIVAYRIGGRIYYKPSELVSALEKLG